MVNNNTTNEINKSYINDFLKNINEIFQSVVSLSGGTQSHVYLVNDKYILKVNEPRKIKLEYSYFLAYKYTDCKFLQQMIYCNKSFKYIVYKYLPGKHLENDFDIKVLNKNVMKFIKKYVESDSDGFGDLNAPKKTWTDFLYKLYTDSLKELHTVFTKSETKEIISLIPQLEKYNFTKKMLHGDLRLNNIIYHKGVLSGIIDPYPLTGDDLFDKLFFIYSSPRLIDYYGITKIHKKLKQPKEKVLIMSLILISVKIKRIIKYNTDKELLTYYKDLYYELYGML